MKINKSKNRYAKKSAGKKATMAKKDIVKVIKSVSLAEIETKTINVPYFGSTTQNSVNISYFALSGTQPHTYDIFAQPQGTTNSSLIGAGNRLGDKIRSVGFLMDYYFTALNLYSILPNYYFIPYVKLRITVYTVAFGTPNLLQSLLYDGNFLNANTSTAQPMNWNEGYLKEVLYDGVHIIRNTLSTQYGGSGTVVQNPKIGNVFHFKKYIKLDRVIRYNENNTLSPNSTERPICMSICAEVDDSITGLVPSSTPILSTTGYTRCWFKDA